MRLVRWLSVVSILVFAWQGAAAFQSDELSEDDDEWGIIGGASTPKVPERARTGPVKSSSNGGVGGGGNTGTGERFGRVNTPADRKVQFTLEHSFGGSEFSAAGVFTARLRDSVKGGQELLDTDAFYSIRVPSNVLSPGKSFALSSVKARCLAESNFQERFDFQMDQGHIIGVTYGGSISCSFPRALRTPSQWTFDSLIIVKTAEQASRALVAPEIVEVAADEDVVAEDGTLVKKLPEKSFWSKYWMYVVPVGLILVNAVTQFANMPEEAPGQGTAGAQQRVGGPAAGGARRRLLDLAQQNMPNNIDTVVGIPCILDIHAKSKGTLATLRCNTVTATFAAIHAKTDHMRTILPFTSWNAEETTNGYEPQTKAMRTTVEYLGYAIKTKTNKRRAAEDCQTLTKVVEYILAAHRNSDVSIREACCPVVICNKCGWIARTLG